MNRHLIFKHYWWIGLLIGSIASCIAFIYGGNDRVGLVGAIIAGVIGFYYFVQQQKLAETQLFHNLFTEFNKRYDSMNKHLASLLEKKDSLTPDEQALIIDYFNLCAEEYLFYKEGYIHLDAWRSWCRGMLWYLRRHPFKDIWHKEVRTESFYGLSLDIIIDGASQP
ncbi:GlsB/YeaQ/YmgE family stress response membrane protein [Aeromonas sp. sif2416]|uniref:GlsB/YeaQ/YmgE family stress response membrane protein n=1 Tax=Aeromonas sp. sif2416 TaxID=2854793 RepID=UPI001C478587|nr:hypothetical protein [Aeromonas sp. sif2416]MBV7437940.1 hypothetical protein [Aeromonas sp. sif2416]